MGDGSTFTVQLNLHHHTVSLPLAQPDVRRILFRMTIKWDLALPDDELPPLTIIWVLQDERGPNG